LKYSTLHDKYIIKYVILKYIYISVYFIAMFYDDIFTEIDQHNECMNE